jgi:acyl-CoA synthetase (NDP forming)
MHPLFYPKNIAVIGVSNNKVSGMKYVIALESFVRDGGAVWPINPKYPELFGYKIYPSLFDPIIPNIDLAIIAVPARFVPDVCRDCAKKGVKFAVIFSSGFSESGKLDLQKELEKAVSESKSKTRFIGPNCLGIDNPFSNVHFYPGMESKKGNVSYLAQSGGTTARLMLYLGSQGIGFQHVVSAGNSVDLSATDFINYYREDPKTKVIALYLESIPNGREFIEAIKKTTPIKPIIIWKGGQTDVGAKAAASHTGGLAGSYQIWKALAKQYGVILASYFEEFAELVCAFSVDQPLPKDRNVGILVAGGGIGVEYTDLCIQYGLNIPPLTDNTIKRLAVQFADVNTSFTNPVDLGEYGYIPNYFAKALEIVASDPGLSTILFVKEAERFKIFEDILLVKDIEGMTIKTIGEALKEIKKPVICSSSPNDQRIKFYEARLNFKNKMIQNNIPVIDYIPNACVVINKLVEYNNYLKKLEKLGKD